MENIILYNADCFEIIKTMPNNSVDAVITDPPYGLSDYKNITELLKSWIEDKEYKNGKGFMGKDWDGCVPSPAIWKEVLRILKPGGTALVFAGSRTQDLMSMSLRLAGFEIKDTVMWLYASGFPKAADVKGQLWKKTEILKNVKYAEDRLLKNPIEIGVNTQKKDFVQENVAVSIEIKKSFANAIIAELNFIGQNHIQKGNFSIVPKNADMSIELLQEHVNIAGQLSQDRYVISKNIFFAVKNAVIYLIENIINKHREGGVLKTFFGNQKYLNDQIIDVLYAELIEGLKLTILNLSKTFQNLDMKLQMECVSATTVIITEYTKESLILNMADIVDKSVKKEIEKQWCGYKSHSIKPAYEPIIMAMKPNDGSYAENALKWGVSGLNVDVCRIDYQSEKDFDFGHRKNALNYNVNKKDGIFPVNKDNIEYKKSYVGDISKGRFPSNVIFSHHPECVCTGTMKIKGDKRGATGGKLNTGNDKNTFTSHKKGDLTPAYGDSEGNETIEQWDCHPDCPVKLLNEQSGVRVSKWGISKKTKREKSNIQFTGDKVYLEGTNKFHGDSGYASRFFFCSKASPVERNEGCEGLPEKRATDGCIRTNSETARKYQANSVLKRNFHPTVKPIEVMKWLCRLVYPPNPDAVILDPFMGSGTTGVACASLGRDFIGIEKEYEYFEIAKARIEREQNKLKQSEIPMAIDSIGCLNKDA